MCIIFPTACAVMRHVSQNCKKQKCTGMQMYNTTEVKNDEEFCGFLLDLYF